MKPTRTGVVAALLGTVVSVGPAWAQALPARLALEETEEKKEEKPKTFWEENKLFAYIENSYTFNRRAFARAGVRELRFYDDAPPRESLGPLRAPIGLYYRLSGVSPFIELVARKP